MKTQVPGRHLVEFEYHALKQEELGSRYCRTYGKEKAGWNEKGVKE